MRLKNAAASAVAAGVVFYTKNRARGMHFSHG